MRKELLPVLTTVLLLAAPGATPSGEVGFAAKPAAARDGGKVKISFAASAPTDCEVAVVDAAGDVVRHLAAGVLGGPNPPPGPLAAGLAQELVWDGQDDFGKPAPAGCRVRVGLGTTAKLGKVLLDERGLAWDPRAASVGPDGLIYVLQEHAQTKSTFLLEAYTQDGKYVRTVMPYPASLPPERLAGLPRARLPDGRWLPAVHHGGFRDLYPESTGVRPQRLPITSKGWIVLVNASKTHNAGGPLPQHLMVVDTAGGTPRASYLGPPVGAERIAHGFCWLALSPDEQWVYACGQLKGGGNDDGFSTPPHNVVYRIGWDDQGLAKPFIGELFKPGGDETHLNAPRGLDTDAQGRIYVCDWGNNRVAVFDAEGKWAGKIDVNAPDQVGLDRKTGAVYVLTWKPDRDPRKCESRLIRFPGLGQPAAAETDIGAPYCTMTVDASGKGVNVWLARTFWERAHAKRGVEKVEDRDGKLGAPVEVIRHRAEPDVYQVGASMVNDDVFVHSYSEHQVVRVDGRSGAVKPLPAVKAHDLAVGPQGQVLILRMMDYGKCLVWVEQYDREGQPLKFPGKDTHVLKELPGNKWGHECTGSKGLGMGPRGEILLIGKLGGAFGLCVFGPDGAARERPAVEGLNYSADGAPAMDLAGNLYAAVAAKLPDEVVPKPFDPAKPPTKWYPWMYGSVAKFPAAGGRLFYKDPEGKSGPWPPAGAEKMLKLISNLRGTEAFAQGALWLCGGFTVTPASNWSVGCCGCYTSHFGLDYWGRVYLPDVGQFSVQVVDGARNPVLRFGDYGNADSAGAGSAIPAPEIPLAWPYAVSVGKSGVYVADFINRRVLRVDLVHAVEESCALP